MLGMPIPIMVMSLIHVHYLPFALLLLFLPILVTLPSISTFAGRFQLKKSSGHGHVRKKKLHYGTHEFSSLPPGPSPWPFVGNLPELYVKKPRHQWILRLMKEMCTDIACIRLGNVHVIPVTCPKIAREFFKKHDAVFASRPITMATDYSSRGFLSVVDAPWGEQWKKMRRVVASHVISRERLNWLHEKRVEEADNLVHYIYNQCCCQQQQSPLNLSSGGAVLDMRSIGWQYSGNVIRKMMFNTRYFGEGRKDGGPGVEEERYVEAIFNLLGLLNAFCVSDYMPCLRWLDLDGHGKLMKEAIRVVNMYHDPIIEERIRKWRRGISDDDDCVFVDNVEKEPEDLLDVLISVKDIDGKPLLSTEEIKAQVGDLIYASIDNPSNAAEWALAEMINQPDLLKRAVNEIDNVVGKDRLVQESDFPHLNYIKACAREAFRLHPIAPFNVPHVSTADSVVAGYFIPKGSHVLLSRTGLGRNPNVWDDPLKFKPERHLIKAGIDSLCLTSTQQVELTESELRFISFSTGRRGCMGSQLGSLMTVMLLARLLQCFTWSCPPGSSTIDLSESENDLFLAKPLRALARPRLPPHLYPTCS